jgi:hypothetical protein
MKVTYGGGPETRQTPQPVKQSIMGLLLANNRSTPTAWVFRGNIGEVAAPNSTNTAAALVGLAAQLSHQRGGAEKPRPSTTLRLPL